MLVFKEKLIFLQVSSYSLRNFETFLVRRNSRVSFQNDTHRFSTTSLFVFVTSEISSFWLV